MTDRNAAMLIGAAAGAAIAEGVVAAAAAARDSGSALATSCALLGAAAVVLLPGLPLSALLGWALGRPGVRMLGRGLRDGLGGGTEQTEGVAGAAVATGLMAVTVAGAAAALLGQRLIVMMTPPYAAAGSAIVGVLALGLSLLVAAPLGRLLATASRAVGRSVGPTQRMAIRATLLLALLALLVGGVMRLLPAEYAAGPLGAAVGLLAGGTRWTRRISLRGWRGGALLVMVTLLSAMAPALLAAMPAAAQSAILYRAPYVALSLGAVRSAFDRDGDGYSRVLLGGDCDDDDPAVHPGAEDLPENGIDENCTGRDARPYQPQRPPPPARPGGLTPRLNVILIQIDALRPDHMGFAGYDRPTTPHLDRLREESTWFRTAYTPAPSTRFAMASLFTGLDARRAPHTDLGYNQFRLDEDARTVAEMLQSRGYDRVGWTISYVMHHNVGFGQGFRTWETPWPLDEWSRHYPTAATETSDKALGYLADHEPDLAHPYLMFLHYRCTHDPYIRYPDHDFGADALDRYDSALAYCDGEIERVLAAVREREDHDRTAVLLVSDHGELFGEHGLTNHGNSLYEPDVRIVLLAHVPGLPTRIPTVDTPVTLTDVAPTLLELASAPVPQGLDGESLLPLMTGHDRPARPVFLFTDLWRGTVHRSAWAVVRFPLKLIRDQRTGATQLFDVVADPEERNDLSAAEPDARAELLELLDSYASYVSSTHGGG